MEDLPILHLFHTLCGKHSVNDFKLHFGLSPIAVTHLFALICGKNKPLPHMWSIEDLLLSLHFLKSPGANLSCSSSRWKKSVNTFKLKVSQTLAMIIVALPQVFDLFYVAFSSHFVVFFF